LGLEVVNFITPTGHKNLLGLEVVNFIRVIGHKSLLHLHVIKIYNGYRL